LYRCSGRAARRMGEKQLAAPGLKALCRTVG
jgi:hypothetical protein